MSVRDIVESTERITDYSPDGPDTRKVSGLDGYFYSARERKLDRANKIQITPIYPPPGYITLGGALSPGKTGKGAPLRPLSFKEHGRDVLPGTKAPESAASQEASDTLIDPEDRREIEDQIAELSATEQQNHAGVVRVI